MNEVMNQIAKDLNIDRYYYESIEAYGSRILYAATVAWAKVQLLGDSCSEELGEMGEKAFSYVSRKYISVHVKKAVNGLLKVIPHIEEWIKVREGCRPESELTRYIIEQLIFCHEINRLMGPQIVTSSPERIVHFKGNELLLGGTSWNNAIRQAKSIGIGNWRIKATQEVSNYKDIFNIPKYNIIQYYRALDKNAVWQVDELVEEYEYFNVNQQLHYYAWGKFEKRMCPTEITILRSAEHKDHYMLVKYMDDQYLATRLDKWYVVEKEIKRIMYALQYKAGTPCIFKAKKDNEVVELNCHSELPNPEWRVMLLSSWPKRQFDDKFYRIVPCELWCNIEEMLEELGITIMFEELDRG